MTLLALTDVSSSFRDGARELVVLDRAGFDVHEGELIGIHGERRSGKSTLLKIAAGLQPADAGTVVFDGRDVAELSARERAGLWRRGGLGLASGDVGPLASGQRTIEHVALPLTGEGLTLAESERLSRPILELVGAREVADMRVERLSLSDRIRVTLARALVREPRLLLVDEPAVLPGPTDARQLLGMLRSLPRERGTAVVIASEDMTALAAVDRFLTLSDGRLRSTDSRRRVIEFPGPRDRRVGGRRAAR